MTFFRSVISHTPVTCNCKGLTEFGVCLEFNTITSSALQEHDSLTFSDRESCVCWESWRAVVWIFKKRLSSRSDLSARLSTRLKASALSRDRWRCYNSFIDSSTQWLEQQLSGYTTKQIVCMLTTKWNSEWHTQIQKVTQSAIHRATVTHTE